MDLNRITASLAIGFSALALHCEPMNEAPPPATPRSANLEPDLPPPADPAHPAPAATSDDSDAQYASGEYAIGASADDYDDDDPSALTDFRANLEPYGTWDDDAAYGTVWVPSSKAVGSDFSPYVTSGHWAYDDDWVWVSDYEWGWAPFHYGRWVWIEGRGWAWIPGRVYRGAWVAWGVDDGYTYVGWAPLAPSFVWFGGAAVAFPGYVAPRWVYCPRGDVFSPGLRGRVIAGAGAAPIAVRVRPYVPARPGVAGPAPQKLGFQAGQIPHAAGVSAAGVVRAQQFARPMTAQALGAHPPAPMMVAPQPAPAARTGSAQAGFGPSSRAPVPMQWPVHVSPSPGHVPAPAAVRSAPMPERSVAPRVPAAPVAPRTFRSAPTFRGGGAGHHR